MDNRQISHIFSRIADALEIQGANPFRVRAYRTASQNISGFSRQLKDIYSEDGSQLSDIPGIGKDLKEKIVELVTTNDLGYYNKLTEEFPAGFLDMLDLSGLGPKKLKKLRDELGVENVSELEKACKAGELESLDGMGAKTQDKLLAAIKHFKKSEGRMLLPEATYFAAKIVEYLSKSRNFKKIEQAGSLRRGRETIGDLDILAVADNAGAAMDYFTNYPDAAEIIVKGATKSSISLKEGPQIDLRIVDEASFGAALVYFTGSKQHNIEMRKIARRKGYKVNEYGVFSVKSGRKVAGRTEEEVYEKIGMSWIPPEMRENRGEIELSRQGTLPRKFLKLRDIKGDLHMHTTASDGSCSIEELARAAKQKGYNYIAITDHSKYVRIAGGMDEKRLLKHVKNIRAIDKKIKGIKILAGVEVDILKNGKLDMDDSVLKELDVVIAAVHSFFALDEKKTNRTYFTGSG